MARSSTRGRLFNVTILIAGWLWICGVPAAAQTAYSERIDVSLTNVDVVVTDASGRRVTGLTGDDFVVRENGRAQSITNFAAYAEGDGVTPVARTDDHGDAPAAAAPVSQSAPSPPRSILLFVERTRLRREKADELFGRLKSTLHTMLRPGDSLTVVSWDKGLLLVRQRATTDFSRLETVIDRLADEAVSIRPNPYRTELASAAAGEDYLREARDFFAAGGLPSQAGAVDTTVVERGEVRRLGGKMQAIIGLIRAFAPTEGRKVLLLVTQRIPVLRGNLTLAEATRVQGVTGKLSGPLQSLILAANSCGVTVYPLVADDTTRAPDMDGRAPVDWTLRTDGPLNPQELSLLHEVAWKTGGEMASSAGDSSHRLPQVAADLDSYYSLAFRTGGSGVRSIEVRTKNPAYRVRSRASYVARSDEQRTEDLALAVLFGNSIRPAFGISVTSRAPERKGAVGKLSIRIPIGALTALPRGDRYEFSFAVAVAGRSARGLTTPVQQTHAFSAPTGDIARARNGYYTYDVDLATDRFSRRVAVAVIDIPSGQYGVASYDLAKSTRPCESWTERESGCSE